MKPKPKPNLGQRIRKLLLRPQKNPGRPTGT